MRLILVRHAEAVDIGTDGVSRDFDRFLTARGRDQASALAATLTARGLIPTAVITSPLVRAKQTAGPLAALLTVNIHLTTDCEFLTPEGYGRKKLSQFVTEHGGDLPVLVGHMPSLGEFAGKLTRDDGRAIDFKKGAAALLAFPGAIEPAAGTLEWVFVPPSKSGEPRM